VLASRRSGKLGAGALSIEAFERGRWRLRRTRQLWVLNGFGRLGNLQFAIGAGAGSAGLRAEWSHGPVGRFGREVFGTAWGAWTVVWAHGERACRSTL
jgi:hypothetical protein